VVNDSEAQRILTSDIIAPEIEESPQKAKWFQIIERLKNEGFLSSIYLEEIGKRGRRLYPAISPSTQLFEESEEFTYFVNRIARREVKEEIPLLFEGRTLKCSVILVARSLKLKLYGDAHHWWRLIKELRGGAETVFLIGITSQGIAAARGIASRAVRTELLSSYFERIFYITENDGKRHPRLIIQCITSPALSKVKETPEEEIGQILHVVIPEIADSKLEIVGIAREPGKMTKVALRNPFDDSDGVLAERVCSKTNENHIMESLGGKEEVLLVPWSNDPAKYISASLGIGKSGLNLSPDVQIEQEKNYCLVPVEKKDDLIALRGNDGINIRLAEQLVGWEIETIISK